MTAGNITYVEPGDVVVRLATPADENDWKEFVHGFEFSGHYFHWEWPEIIERTFGHSRRSLIARIDGRVAGVLPLSEVRSLLVGHGFVSLPYLNGGGPLTALPESARALLVESARLTNAASAKYAELRCSDARTDPPWVGRAHKVRMHLPLLEDPAAVFSRFDSKLRSQIRRGEKSGALVRTARGSHFGQDELDGFYRVFSVNMRDLGTPVYPRRLFSNALKAFGPMARLTTVWVGSECIAGGITLGAGRIVEVPWASSLRRTNHLAANMLLYWHLISDACRDGYGLFDFGRSTPGSGPYRFKEQWGAVPVPQHWLYLLPGASRIPDLDPRSKRNQFLVNTWRRLPLQATNLLGPWLTKSLP
jgi:FemAB-related protein (PEP-CTERM system-associated)